MEVGVGEKLAVPDGRFAAPRLEDTEEEINPDEKNFVIWQHFL